MPTGDPPKNPPPPTAAPQTGDRALVRRAQETRERVIARLSDHFAHDDLDVDEFERRVTVAQTADDPADIEALLADLKEVGGTAVPVKAIVPTVVTDLAPAGNEQEMMYAIFGGIDRRGTWTVPRRLKIVAMWGGASLDLREARFPPGVIDIEVKAVMGGIQIIVPPGLAVQMHGSAIFGGFQDVNRAPAHPDPNAPLLRIHGLAMMGGVNIEMRLPGESERGARRRERRELRDARRDERRELRDEKRARRLLDRER